MHDFLSSKIKDKSFIFNRLPKGQKVQLNFLGKRAQFLDKNIF